MKRIMRRCCFFEGQYIYHGIFCPSPGRLLSSCSNTSQPQLPGPGLEYQLYTNLGCLGSISYFYSIEHIPPVTCHQLHCTSMISSFERQLLKPAAGFSLR